MSERGPVTSRRAFVGGALATGIAAAGGPPTASAEGPPAQGLAATAPAPRGAPAGRYRIDLHAHVLPPEYRSALLSRGMFTIGGFPTSDWSPEAAVDFMDRYGIQAQVLSVSDPGVSFLRGLEAVDLARSVNTYLAELVAREPGRFGALAVLPLPDVAASITELTHALDVLHLDGVALLSAYDDVYLGDPRLEPLMWELNRRGAYVFVHPRSLPPQDKPSVPLPDFLMEFTFDTTRAAALLIAGETLARYPRIRFQLAHAGGTLPFLAHRIGIASETVIGQQWPHGMPRPSALEVARSAGTFFYDTALSPAPASMGAVLAVADRSRVVFGSDWPFSALTLSGAGDPQPALGQTFEAQGRLQIERLNALRELPRLAEAVGG